MIHPGHVGGHVVGATRKKPTRRHVRSHVKRESPIVPLYQSRLEPGDVCSDMGCCPTNFLHAEFRAESLVEFDLNAMASWATEVRDAKPMRTSALASPMAQKAVEFAAVIFLTGSLSEGLYFVQDTATEAFCEPVQEGESVRAAASRAVPLAANIHSVANFTELCEATYYRDHDQTAVKYHVFLPVMRPGVAAPAVEGCKVSILHQVNMSTKAEAGEHQSQHLSPPAFTTSLVRHFFARYVGHVAVATLIEAAHGGGVAFDRAALERRIDEAKGDVETFQAELNEQQSIKRSRETALVEGWRAEDRTDECGLLTDSQMIEETDFRQHILTGEMSMLAEDEKPVKKKLVIAQAMHTQLEMWSSDAYQSTRPFRPAPEHVWAFRFFDPKRSGRIATPLIRSIILDHDNTIDECHEIMKRLRERQPTLSSDPPYILWYEPIDASAEDCPTFLRYRV